MVSTTIQRSKRGHSTSSLAPSQHAQQSHQTWQFHLVNFESWSLASVKALFEQTLKVFQTIDLKPEQLPSRSLDIEDQAWLHLVCHHADKHLQELNLISQLQQTAEYSCAGSTHYYQLADRYAVHAYPQSPTFEFDRLCLEFLQALGVPSVQFRALADAYEADYNLLLCQTWHLRVQAWWDRAAA